MSEFIELRRVERGEGGRITKVVPHLFNRAQIIDVTSDEAGGAFVTTTEYTRYDDNNGQNTTYAVEETFARVRELLA